MKNSKGLLIVFEGIDGSGKTSQARLLAENLRKLGYDIIQSREPTKGKYGKMLHDSMRNGRYSAEEELDLFIKDRRDHVENFIQPHLQKKSIVILDRFYFSNAAYQGIRGFNYFDIITENEKFAPSPDIVFLLDLAPENGLARIESRDGNLGANEFEKICDLAKVRKLFLQIFNEKFIKIDANREPEEIGCEVLKHTIKKINQYEKTSSKSKCTNKTIKIDDAKEAFA